jgi:hypothetical protein
MDELYKLAGKFLAMNGERDTANEIEDYDGAFEIECDQRDVGSEMADIIYKLYNEKMNSKTPEDAKVLVDQLANEADGGVEILVENIMNGYPEEYILDAVPSTIKTLLEGALAAKRKTNAKAEQSDVEVAKPPTEVKNTSPNQ